MRQTEVAPGMRGRTGSPRNRKRRSDTHHTPGNHHCQPRSNRSSTRGSRLKWTGNGLLRLVKIFALMHINMNTVYVHIKPIGDLNMLGQRCLWLNT